MSQTVHSILVTLVLYFTLFDMANVFILLHFVVFKFEIDDSMLSW